jgi:CBS domain-containing protein
VKVVDVMRRDVRTVGPETSLSDIIVLLAEAHISAVPVVDRHSRILGVVSSTDILLSEADAGGGADREAFFRETSARDIMTPRPLTISPDTDLKEAARQMLYAEVHRLFITDHDRLVGVVSTTDIVQAVATRPI